MLYRRSKQVNGTIETKLCRFLLSYQTSMQASRGETPVQLRWGRTLRTHGSTQAWIYLLIRLKLLKPARSFNTTNAVSQDHSKWEMQYKFATTQEIRNGAMEQFLNTQVLYLSHDGTVVRRHYDQLLKN